VHVLVNVGTTGSPVWRPSGSDPLVLTRGSNATPALGDLDGDGDLDLLVGEASGGMNHFENVGSATRASFVLADDDLLPPAATRRSVPLLVDWDADGDLDLGVGTEADGILYYENRGDARAARFTLAESPFPPASELPSLAAPAFGDLDGDGTPELIVGGLGGGLLYFRR
jgi:hypothetical protein